MSPEVVALGEAMVELAAVEPGPLRSATRFEMGWGGDTSNFAIAVRRLGCSSGYVTRLGDDEFAASLLALWEREGVDTAGVSLVPGEFTGAYFLSRDAQSKHGFTYFRRGSAASGLTPSDLPLDYIISARAFHTSGITQAISTTACDAAFSALHSARRAGMLTTYDVNLRAQLWAIDRARAIILHALSFSEIAFANVEEAAILTELEEPDRMAAALLDRGPSVAVLKRGPAGALVSDGKETWEVPGYAVESVDAAGAGDTFAAAFIVGLLEGRSLPECAEFANAAAALTTTGLGCVAPIPDRARVEELRSAQRAS